MCSPSSPAGMGSWEGSRGAVGMAEGAVAGGSDLGGSDLEAEAGADSLSELVMAGGLALGGAFSFSHSVHMNLLGNLHPPRPLGSDGLLLPSM